MVSQQLSVTWSLQPYLAFAMHCKAALRTCWDVRRVWNDLNYAWGLATAAHAKIHAKLTGWQVPRGDR